MAIKTGGNGEASTVGAAHASVLGGVYGTNAEAISNNQNTQ